MRDLVTCPVVHRAEGGVLAQLGIRHRAVDPVEQAEERPRVEHLVVDRPQGLGPSDDLSLVIGLGLAEGLGEAEPRRGHEQVEGGLVGQRGTDDPVRLFPERQLIPRRLPARARLGLVDRPLVDAEDGLPGLALDLQPELDRLGEDDLFLRRQELDAGDLAQVQPDRIAHLGIAFDVRLRFRGSRDRDDVDRRARAIVDGGAVGHALNEVGAGIEFVIERSIEQVRQGFSVA